ncbi:hypothetical protein [Polyangium sp. y55x31]|uniref:hypothetical protein n=1 Tax=Polyangium sp. y55x31 TaxID=3042688 RepID=UPI002482785C|nr:hypothetical protein [Polyangium sp. y55x31]MDI1478908.1 hypothetical protein [Polyangium sp. y55x31]
MNPTKWLVTTRAHVTAEELQAALSPNATVDRSEPPIPLGEDEKVYVVLGPADLDRSLALTADVLGISPVSPMTLW